MWILQKIAEQRIKEAMEEGQFDDLPGKGEPLVYEDDSRVPEDLRLAYKVLRNANCIPPELWLKQEIRQLEDLLSVLKDEKEKYMQIKRLNFQILKLNMLRKRPITFEENQYYYEQVVGKLGNKRKP
jgi:hypothetical protein